MRVRDFLIEQQKARADQSHFGEKELDIIIILVRGFAKMLSCHNKSKGSLRNGDDNGNSNAKNK